MASLKEEGSQVNRKERLMLLLVFFVLRLFFLVVKNGKGGGESVRPLACGDFL
jgi:hypothetical protein